MHLRTGFWLLTAFLLSILSALVFAETNDVVVAISGFCTSLTSLLPTVAMLLVLVGAVVYAAGQVMGAETRARANVWATVALTGAFIGIFISAVAPSALETAYGHTVSCSAGMCGGAVLQAGQGCCAGSAYDASTLACCNNVETYSTSTDVCCSSGICGPKTTIGCSSSGYCCMKSGFCMRNEQCCSNSCQSNACMGMEN